MTNFMPPPHDMLKEIILVTVGIIGAAWVISKFPKVQTFVASNSITVKDQDGRILW